jgi:hypothetical protein
MRKFVAQLPNLALNPDATSAALARRPSGRRLPWFVRRQRGGLERYCRTRIIHLRGLPDAISKPNREEANESF